LRKPSSSTLHIPVLLNKSARPVYQLCLYSSFFFQQSISSGAVVPIPVFPLFGNRHNSIYSLLIYLFSPWINALPLSLEPIGTSTHHARAFLITEMVDYMDDMMMCWTEQREQRYRTDSPEIEGAFGRIDRVHWRMCLSVYQYDVLVSE
jgi:hypothetical protein